MMGNKSARMQKMIFPRSRTKAESRQDKIFGKPEYPSVKASQYVDVDPEQTPDYKNVLKNVSLNIRSFNNNPVFKGSNIHQPKSLEESSLEDKVPPGYLDKEMLASLFTVDKNNPKIHTKYHLTEQELEKIFDWFSGYTTREAAPTNESDDVVDSLKNKILNATAIDPSDDPAIMVEKLKGREKEQLYDSISKPPKKFLKERTEKWS